MSEQDGIIDLAWKAQPSDLPRVDPVDETVGSPLHRFTLQGWRGLCRRQYG